MLSIAYAQPDQWRLRNERLKRAKACLQRIRSIGIAARHSPYELDFLDNYRYMAPELMSIVDAVKSLLTTYASSATLCSIQEFTSRAENMNRQKKLKQLFKAKAKKASAKLAPKKPKYINKADRLKLAVEAGADPITSPES